MGGETEAREREEETGGGGGVNFANERKKRKEEKGGQGLREFPQRRAKSRSAKGRKEGVEDKKYLPLSCQSADTGRGRGRRAGGGEDGLHQIKMRSPE